MMNPFAMPFFAADPAEPPSRAERLAAEPGAGRWAALCGWVPGTGHCRGRACAEACVFRPQRLAEAARVSRWRRLRRMFARR
jgi:hypothetical protein